MTCLGTLVPLTTLEPRQSWDRIETFASTKQGNDSPILNPDQHYERSLLRATRLSTLAPKPAKGSGKFTHSVYSCSHLSRLDWLKLVGRLWSCNGRG